MHTLQFGLLVALAAITVVTDVRRHRIPNVVCLAGVVLGLALHAMIDGWSGLLGSGLIGLIAGFALFLPYYAIGGMAAGDVKLMAAMGCVLGFPIALWAVVASLLSGTLLGLAYLVLRGGWPEVRDRYWMFLKVLFRTGRFILPPAEAGAASRTRFPYAVAIAIGSLGVGLYGLAA